MPTDHLSLVPANHPMAYYEKRKKVMDGNATSTPWVCNENKFDHMYKEPMTPTGKGELVPISEISEQTNRMAAKTAMTSGKKRFALTDFG